MENVATARKPWVTLSPPKRKSDDMENGVMARERARHSMTMEKEASQKRLKRDDMERDATARNQKEHLCLTMVRREDTESGGMASRKLKKDGHKTIHQSTKLIKGKQTVIYYKISERIHIIR